MSTQAVFQSLLILATLLCSLVAGFLFAFAIVVMPGIKSLPNREFIRAFQVMDGVIQRNQPLFVLVWVGSLVVLALSVVFGYGQLAGVGRLLLVFATLAYILGVQVPTLTVNVPLNNRLQALDLDAMAEAAEETARNDFEARWNRWNSIRTVIACLVSALLMILLLML